MFLAVAWAGVPAPPHGVPAAMGSPHPKASPPPGQEAVTASKLYVAHRYDDIRDMMTSGSPHDAALQA